jgi:hypothetical protein
MKNPTQHHIAEVPSRSSKVGMTIGIDLGDVGIVSRFEPAREFFKAQASPNAKEVLSCFVD